MSFDNVADYARYIVGVVERCGDGSSELGVAGIAALAAATYPTVQRAQRGVLRGEEFHSLLRYAGGDAVVGKVGRVILDGTHGGGRGEVRDAEPQVVVGSKCGGDGVASVAGGVTPSLDVSKKAVAARAKRARRALRRKEERERGSHGSDVRADGDGQAVPEWRRKDVRAVYHKGAFADCSDAVQRQLRETRALRLVAENKAAVLVAEQKQRVVTARIKSRVVEEEVERNRLKSAAEYEKLAAEWLARKPAGYAETMMSIGESVPSLSSGSVSPNSSISVAELRRREDAFIAAGARIKALEAQVATLTIVKVPEKKKPVSVRKVVKPVVPLVGTLKEREEAEFEREFAKYRYYSDEE